MRLRQFVTLLCVTNLMITSVFSHASATSRAINWEGIPLQITLNPGKETILYFEDDVRIAMPAFLTPTLSASSLAGRVYLTSNDQFDTTRLHVERLSDGLRLLFDVNATNNHQASSKIDIRIPSSKHDTSSQSTTIDQTNTHIEKLKMPIQALLIRYAMQSLYSPSHAIEPLPGVHRSVMGLPKDIQASTFSYWRVSTHPIASWQLEEHVVTAVRINNLRSQKQVLDPRQVTLGGSCLLSSCQVSFSYPTLGPMGSKTDRSTAFIVTPGSLKNHLLPVPSGKEMLDE